MDIELFVLSIIFLSVGIIIALRNKYWKLSEDDPKKVVEIQLFYSGLISTALGILIFLKILGDL